MCECKTPLHNLDNYNQPRSITFPNSKRSLELSFVRLSQSCPESSREPNAIRHCSIRSCIMFTGNILWVVALTSVKNHSNIYTLDKHTASFVRRSKNIRPSSNQRLRKDIGLILDILARLGMTFASRLLSFGGRIALYNAILQTLGSWSIHFGSKNVIFCNPQKKSIQHFNTNPTLQKTIAIAGLSLIQSPTHCDLTSLCPGHSSSGGRSQLQARGHAQSGQTNPLRVSAAIIPGPVILRPVIRSPSPHSLSFLCWFSSCQRCHLSLSFRAFLSSVAWVAT